MKRLVLMLCMVALSASCWAQFTTVTGTVTDPNGLPYAFGTLQAVIVSSGTPIFTATGAPYFQPLQASGLDSTGTFRVTLADNTFLSPAGTKWNFTVCSAIGSVPFSFGKGPVCFSLAAPITISGSSQSITSNLTAVAPALTVNFGGVQTISGSGTTNTIPLWTASSVLGNSSITDTTNGGALGGGYYTQTHTIWNTAQQYIGNNPLLGQTSPTAGICSNLNDCGPLLVGQNYSALVGGNAAAIASYPSWTGSGSVNIHLMGIDLLPGLASTGSGTVASQRGANIQTSATGYTVTNDYGININAPVIGAGGVLTHHYGLFLADQTGSGAGTNSDPHGIYVAGGGVQVAVHAFSTLPTCNASQEGRFEAVSDATSATNGVAVVGGGGHHVLAYCNGASWLVTVGT